MEPMAPHKFKIGDKLRVIDARNVPRIYEARKVQMLSTFAEGFFEAQAELRGMRESGSEEGDEKRDPAQRGFFDDIS
jgi:hypothetical protein